MGILQTDVFVQVQSEAIITFTVHEGRAKLKAGYTEKPFTIPELNEARLHLASLGLCLTGHTDEAHEETGGEG